MRRSEFLSKDEWASSASLSMYSTLHTISLFDFGRHASSVLFSLALPPSRRWMQSRSSSLVAGTFTLTFPVSRCVRTASQFFRNDHVFRYNSKKRTQKIGTGETSLDPTYSICLLIIIATKSYSGTACA